MRFRLTLAAGFLAVSLIAVAQQSTRVSPSNEFKVNNGSGKDVMHSSAPPVRVTGTSTKDLESIERRTPTGSVSHPARKAPAAALPAEHGRPAAKIDFKPNANGKAPGLSKQSTNPLAGRLRGKGSW